MFLLIIQKYIETMGTPNSEFYGMFAQGSAKNASFEQPDSGKILPDKSDNFHFLYFSELVVPRIG